MKKEAEKSQKYKHRTTQIKRKWNVKTNVMPLITGATGTISKSETTRATYRESTTSKNYRKQPYLVRHTYFEKY